jgi:hypothetical protein
LIRGTDCLHFDPTTPPTNTPFVPPHRREVCKPWDEWHGSNGWDLPNYFGGWIYERHGFDGGGGSPTVNNIILRSVTIVQDDKSKPQARPMFIKVGLAGDIRQVAVSQTPDEVTKYLYKWHVNNLNIDLPLCGSGCDPYYRIILLEVWFEEELTGAEYWIEGEFYFPEYDETCSLNISAKYKEDDPHQDDPNDPGDPDDPDDPIDPDDPDDPPAPVDLPDDW